MKSKLIHSNKATEAAPTYPALYKSTKTDLVVLATDETTGTVVVGNVVYRPGDYLETWVSFNDYSNWLRLSRGEKVVLEND